MIDESGRICVPSACCLELATLERRGRVAFDRGASAWIRAALADDRVEELPLTAEIAIEAGRLPETFPGDLIDRVVYATAAVVGSRLVTGDRRITSYDPERVVW